MKRIAFIFFCTLPLLFSGCAGDNNNDQNSNDEKSGVTSIAPPNTTAPSLPVPTDSFLINQVKANLTGLNNEDLAWAMEPLHMSSPYMQDPEYHIRGAFLVYELNFKLVSTEIEFKSDTACVAKIIHDSQNDNEREYISQRSVQRYTWKPEGDQWKIWKMEVLGNTPL